jgi:hypothetical protein
MPAKTEYHAPGQEPRTKRYRQGDHGMADRLNALFDRWRGPVVFFFPICAALLVSLGFQYISPSDRLDLQAQSIDLLIARVDRADSTVKAINTKLDLLVDLACDRFTAEQRLVTKRVVECAK